MTENLDAELTFRSKIFLDLWNKAKNLNLILNSERSKFPLLTLIREWMISLTRKSSRRKFVDDENESSSNGPTETLIDRSTSEREIS